MGIYKYWHGDVEFAATYDYLLPEPAAGVPLACVEITDFNAVSYRTLKSRLIHPLRDEALIEAINSLEQFFWLDDKYRQKREEEAFEEHMKNMKFPE